MHVKDADGNSYLDFFGGILTISVGHANDTVNAAVKAQIDRLGHVSTLYPTLPIVQLAETLARLTPGRLRKSMFTGSGTEADETAVMLAQVYTGRLEIIALRHGYSGRSILAQSLTAQAPVARRALAGRGDQARAGALLLPLPAQARRTRPAGSPARRTSRSSSGRPRPGRSRASSPSRSRASAASSRRRRSTSRSPSASSGNTAASSSATRSRRASAAPGRHWFGISHWNVEPEIMTMAKGVANGMPLGVTIATPEVADSFKALTISTFGGNPVSSAAANATIAVLEEIDAPKRAAETGGRLRAGLDRLKSKYARKRLVTSGAWD
jgi:alanine-glyoxylate transaminase/(R)-3-amino-2-methylpropionate-pyruvate transaminase